MSMQQSALRTRTLILLLPAMSLLTGCTTAGGCDLIPLKAYAPAFNKTLADEIVAAPQTSLWPQAIRDYVSLRDTIKACRGKT